MKDTIILNLPYPVHFLGVRLLIKRKIGFLFTNLALFLFREGMKIETSEDFKKWQAENGEARVINEMLYYSAVAYCMQFKVRQNFTKSLLTVAITSSSLEDQTKLIDAWKSSQTFGAKIEKKNPSKKRLTTPKSTPFVSAK